MNLYYISFLTIFFYLLTSMIQGSGLLDKHPPPIMLIHIFISFIAMSLLILASAQALLMGCQHYWLKKRRHARPWHRLLPPLQTMEKGLFNSVLGGTSLLSASLISGFFFQPGALLSWFQPKIVLAFSAWIGLMVLLLGRRYGGWRGTTAIRWTLSATLLAWLCLK